METGRCGLGLRRGSFATRTEAFSLDEDLNSGTVTAIAEDPAGRLIVAVYGQVWVREGGRFRKLLEKKSGVIWSIYPDRDGTLWFGWELGLIRFKDGLEVVYTTNDGLAGNDVKVIIDDAAGGRVTADYSG